MKFLTLLSAFYILLLPCFSCTDTGNCNDNFKTEVISFSADNKNDQHENEICNPFCSCACCGHIFTPNFQLDKPAVTKSIVNLKQQFFYRNISPSSDFYGNIWQPPKFS